MLPCWPPYRNQLGHKVHHLHDENKKMHMLKEEESEKIRVKLIASLNWKLSLLQ